LRSDADTFDLAGLAALGGLARLWHRSQYERRCSGTADQINLWFGLAGAHLLLCDAQLIEKIGDDEYRIRGNAEQIDNLEKKRINGKKGGDAKQKNKNDLALASTCLPPASECLAQPSACLAKSSQSQSQSQLQRKIQIQDFDLRSTADTIENAETLPLRGPNPAPSAFDSVPVSEEVEIVDSGVGKVSTLTQLPKLTPTRQKRQKNDAETPPGALVWEAYAAAYEERYRVAPIRNARQNAIAARIAKSMGLDDAILCARHFLVINDQFFLKCGHAFKLLESNWESILLQAKKGVRYTQAAAKIADRDSHNDDVGRRVIEQFRLREEKARTNEPIEEGKTQYGKI
jgi:hypothetical protein